MKQFLIACLVLLAACNNEGETNKEAKVDTPATKTAEPVPDNKVMFKVGEESVTTTASNINRFDFKNGAGIAINITSNMKTEPRTVNLNVNATKPGTYPFDGTASALSTAGKAYGDYMPDGNAEKKDHYFFKSGNLTIIDIDTAKRIINASFSGEAKNDKGKTLQITDGKVVMGVMQPGITSL